jgi:hypothetical protein
MPERRMIPNYVCRHCGAPHTPEAAATSSSCPNCGRPWQAVTRAGGRGAPGILDLAGIRERLHLALQTGDEALVEQVSSTDIPAVFSLLGELSTALAAINGRCTCTPLRVKRRVGPCPHYRANLALRRMGVEPDDLARLRAQLDRSVP